MNGDDTFGHGQWYPEPTQFATDSYDVGPRYNNVGGRYAGNAPWSTPITPQVVPELAKVPAPPVPAPSSGKPSIPKSWVIVICVLVAVVIVVGIYLFWQFAIGNKKTSGKSGGSIKPNGRKLIWDDHPVSEPPIEDDEDVPEPVVMLAESNDPLFVRER
jgi:hypothetical protein